MSPDSAREVLSVFRWYLLVAALVNLVFSTVLFERAGRPLTMACWRAIAPPGRRVPDALVNPVVHRVVGVVGTGVTLAMWWYLGTPDGVALVQNTWTVSSPR